jgi:Fe-S-cluster formation regulator IscX/YfhJ
MAADLPDIDAWRADLRRCLPKTDPVRPVWAADAAAIPWGTLGLAIDARLRLALTAAGIEQVLVMGPASYTVDALLTDGTGFDTSGRDLLTHDVVVGLPVAPPELQPRRRALGVACREVLAAAAELCRQAVPSALPRLLLESDIEQRLCRMLLVASWLEEVARTGRIFPGSALDRLIAKGASTAQEVLELVPAAAVDDVVGMLARAEAVGDWVLLRQRTPVHPGPTFAGSRLVGGADADLIAGTLLVDVKATVDPRRAKKSDLQQLIGYALLDFDDGYALDEVGFFYARHGVLVSWPLSDLLVLLGAKDAMPVLRERVASLEPA